MVRGIVNGTITFYPGRHFSKEIANNITKVQKFYFAGTMTIAIRTLENSTDVLNWVLGDHLGSTSATANADGSLNSVIQYTAYGREALPERSAGREIRLTQGVTPTKYRYTGQLAQAELGLDYYVARWYDPVLGHFTQADTIIPEPGKSQGFDRYAYVMNNPLRYVDPSGHKDAGPCSPGDVCNKEPNNPPVGCKSGKLCLISTITPSKISTNTNTQNSIKTSTYLPDIRQSSTPSPKMQQKTEPKSTQIYRYYYQPHSPYTGTIGWEMDPNEPDYYTYTVSAVIFSGSVTFDRYKNVYVGPGLSIGKGIPIGFSAAKGYIIRGSIISESDTQGFLQDLSMGGSIACIVGKGENYPYAGPIDHSEEDIFIGTPQIGVYTVFKILIINNHSFGY